MENPSQRYITRNYFNLVTLSINELNPFPRNNPSVKELAENIQARKYFPRSTSFNYKLKPEVNPDSTSCSEWHRVASISGIQEPIITYKGDAKPMLDSIEEMKKDIIELKRKNAEDEKIFKAYVLKNKKKIETNEKEIKSLKEATLRTDRHNLIADLLTKLYERFLKETDGLEDYYEESFIYKNQYIFKIKNSFNDELYSEQKSCGNQNQTTDEYLSQLQEKFLHGKLFKYFEEKRIGREDLWKMMRTKKRRNKNSHFNLPSILPSAENYRNKLESLKKEECLLKKFAYENDDEISSRKIINIIDAFLKSA